MEYFAGHGRVVEHLAEADFGDIAMGYAGVGGEAQVIPDDAIGQGIGGAADIGRIIEEGSGKPGGLVRRWWWFPSGTPRRPSAGPGRR